MQPVCSLIVREWLSISCRSSRLLQLKARGKSQVDFVKQVGAILQSLRDAHPLMKTTFSAPSLSNLLSGKGFPASTHVRAALRDACGAVEQDTSSVAAPAAAAAKAPAADSVPAVSASASFAPTPDARAVASIGLGGAPSDLAERKTAVDAALAAPRPKRADRKAKKVVASESVFSDLGIVVGTVFAVKETPPTPGFRFRLVRTIRWDDSDERIFVQWLTSAQEFSAYTDEAGSVDWLASEQIVFVLAAFSGELTATQRTGLIAALDT